MKQLYLALLASISSLCSFSQFDYYATAALIELNGNPVFYNNSSPGNNQNIGNITFQDANLGSFGRQTGNLKIIGAEVKTFKGPGGNVCSSTLFFTVYPQGARPVSPTYTSIGLGFYANCTETACETFPSAFPLAKGGGCCNPGDQKWQFPAGGNGGGNDGNIDLTNREPGNYTLELFYQVTGETNEQGCSESRYDNHASAPANYTANFSITGVLPLTIGKLSVFRNPQGNVIRWNCLCNNTAAEFVVERSEDGMHFNTVAKVSATNTFLQQNHYSYTDGLPAAGRTYYRVKVRENTGKTSYSTTVLLQGNGTYTTAVNPNPASSQVQIFVQEAGSHVRIINAAGIVELQAIAPNQVLRADVSRLTPGRYQVLVSGEWGTTSMPLMIIR